MPTLCVITTIWPSERRFCKPLLTKYFHFYENLLNYSVEIPTKCSFVIEFIIPKFIEGSTCFERHTAHHQEL
jgi:hypothetical protein